MARKKNAEKVKIEAAPVLRSGGDDSTPETPVITKSYIMRDDWKDKGVVNTVAFKSVDGEVQDLLVNGEPAGGGGGVGKTIKITVTGGDQEGECYANVQLGNPASMRALFITADNNYTLGAQLSQDVTAEDGHVNVLLIKDHLEMDVITADGYTASVTGDAAQTIPGSYNVTGNCTVTFTAI